MGYNEHKIGVYKSLFRGRDDTYAVRWEKEGRTGYMPARKVDWSNYDKHKAQGGTFKNYQHKEDLPFDDSAIESHIRGNETCGIYPLLEDNTSFFIAVDFDKENWKETILELYKTCGKFSIKSYIERSRSGNGGHLWVFFENAFPAKQSRKIMFEILRQAGIISHFEKEPSFDRLFPNQDFHSGKGFGNLISLPLNGKSMEHGNTCFLNPDSFVIFEDQWAFLESVTKVSVTKLKALYEELFNIVPENALISSPSSSYGHDLEIIIQNQIFLKRNQLSKKLIAF